MQYATFGPTGMQISRLALGTMGFGAQIARDETARVVDEAIDHGINLIDTAESYGDSEAILGELLQGGKRDQVYLATKVYRRRAQAGRCGNNSRVNIILSVERSLQLLRTDHVDLYQLHHPDTQTPLDETLHALDRMIQAGKVRYVGVSNHYAWQMAMMLCAARRSGQSPIVSYQGCYNMLDRPIESEIVPFCQRVSLAILVYSPLCGGMLTGKYQRGQTPPADSRVAKWGKAMRDFHEDPAIHDMLDEIRSAAESQGVTPAQLAILWLLAKPFVSTVLLGGSRPEHYTPMYPISDKTLPPELVERLDALTQRQIHKPHRNQACVQGSPLPGWV